MLIRKLLETRDSLGMAVSRSTLSLRHSLYLLTLVALAPAIFLLAYNEIVLRQDRLRELHQSALRMGEQQALELQRIVVGAQSVLLSLARAPSIRSFNAELCIPYLDDILRSLPQFSSIAVLDASGLVRCRNEMPAQAVYASDRPYFQQVMEGKGFVVGSYQLSRITGQAQVPLAYPVHDDAGAISGVIVAGLDVAWLNKVVNERAFASDEALTIADRDGVIVARHPLADRFVGTKIPEPYRSLVTASNPGTVELMSQDGTRRIVGYVPASYPPEGFYVSAGIGADRAMAPINSASQRSLIAIVAGAALAFVLAALTGTKLIGEPLNHINRTIQRWRGGDDTARTGMSHGNEIYSLGAAIDAFMDELERNRLERRQTEEHKTLLANELAHRVKNTLATVRAIAAQTFKGKETKPAMTVFSDRIVALGKAYDLLRTTEWQSADLLATVESALLPYPKEQFELSGPPLHLFPRATLALTMALHELATNAAKYGALSAGDGRVLISWIVAEDRFFMEWREQNGPPVQMPQTTGFGTRMIEQILANDLSGKVVLSYDPAGLICRIEAPSASTLDPTYTSSF